VRALCALGILEPAGEAYRAKPSLAPLFRAGEGDLAPFLEHSHEMYDRWASSLEPWLRGEPWRARARTAEGARRFGEAMRAMGWLVSGHLIEALDLEGVRRVLDIGGGTGVWARRLCRAAPGISAVVLDAPEVAEIGRAEIAGTDLEDRIAFVGGDYRESDLGSGYDLVLVANVLHQELAAGAADLVRRAAGALAPGGRLAIVDFAIDDARRERAVGALFAINMRSFGDTHAEPAIRSWMVAAGLEPEPRVDLDSVRWLLTARRPG